MKKTAFLLSVILTLLCFPSLPASSVSVATTVSSLQELLGDEDAALFEINHYDFSVDTYTGVDYNMVVNDPGFTQENGLVLESGKNSYFRIIKELYWSPISNGTVATFRARVMNETDALVPLWQKPTTTQEKHRAALSIKASGLSQIEGQSLYLDQNFAPGLGWVDYYLKSDTDSQWSIYARPEGETAITLVAQGLYGTNGGDGTGLYFSGAGYVKTASLYQLDTYASLYDFSMDSNFDTTMRGITTTGDMEYTDGNGLVMSSDSQWVFLPEEGWSGLADGMHVAFRVKIPDTGRLNFQVAAPDTSLARKVYVDISTTSLNVVGSASHSGYDAATPEFSFTPGNDWIDCMVKANGNDSYSFYLLLDGEWKLYAKTEGYTDAGAAHKVGIAFYSSHSTTYIQNVRLFQTDSLQDIKAKPAAKTQPYYVENFDSVPDYQNSTSSGDITLGDGTLILKNTASFGVTRCEIPQGGYAEFKLASDSAPTSVCFSDGSSALTLNFQNQASVNGTTLPVTDSGNVFRLWRIRKNDDGTYNGYVRSEQESTWHVAFQNMAGTDTTMEKGFLISQSPHDGGTAEGVTSVDYFRLYGPFTGNSIIITDGPGTILVSKNGRVSSPDSICVVVDTDYEHDRTLVLAEYNQKKVVIRDEIHPIAKGEEPFSTIYSVTSDPSDTWNVKAFLWDENQTPLAMSFPIRSGKPFWNDTGWQYGGNFEAEEGVTTLKAQTDTDAYAASSLNLNSTFDLTWEMSIDSLAEHSTVTISNGTAESAISVTPSQISFESASQTKIITHPIGTDKHTYRVVGNGNNWDLYLDGNMICDMDSLPLASNPAGILVEVSGNDAMIKLYSVSVSPYNLLDDPTRTQNFDNGDMANWNQYEVFPVSNDVGYFCWSSQDGILKMENPTYLSPRCQQNIEIKDDFVLESRMRFENLGNWFYILMGANNHSLHLEVHHNFLTLITPVDDPTTDNFQDAHSDPVWIDSDRWYNLRIESYNNSEYVRVYLDDELIMEDQLADYPNYPNQLIQFGGYGCHVDDCIVHIDWLRYVPTETRTENTLPLPTYNASATLSALQSGTSLSASLGALNNFDSVASVSYFLDGVPVTTSVESPYSGTISTITPENHVLQAVGYDNTGIPISESVKEIPVADGTASLNYSNEIRYTATGDGTVEFSNGNHKVSMQHSSSALIYQTDTGAESYSFGTGTFCIITDGPIAEVYRNGQFAFSYYLPRTTQQTSSTSGNIADYTVSATPERKNYFVSRNLTTQNKVYNLADFPYSYNLDFIAGADHHATLRVNDGFYLSEVSVEDGKLYVWDAMLKTDFSEKIFVEEVTEDAYYRVETSGGMSRLYKNGRWIFTFRGEHALGNPYLSVNIPQGTLPYLSVNDSTDVYLYEDNFDETGEISALDFWRTETLTPTLQNGNLILDASEKTDAITELYAFSGEFDLSAKVNVSPIDPSISGGFWFLLNHSITNTYTKAGWNHQSSQSDTYEIVDRIDGVNQPNSASKSGTLPTGQTVQLDLKARRTEEGETITLYVNGSEVISQTGHFERYGKVGFILSNCTATIEEISYRGNARPVPKANDAIFPIGITSGGMRDLLEFDNGDVYIINHIEGLCTNDGGETWTDVESKLVFQKDENGNDTHYVDTKNTIGITRRRKYGWNNNMLRLQNGTYLSVAPHSLTTNEYNKRLMNFTVAQSTDGLHWSDIESQNPPFYQDEIGISPTVNVLKQGASGRIYFTYHEGSNEDIGGVQIWYSDDNGMNWNHGSTIHGKDVGHVLAESQVVEDGTSTKLFFRTDLGYICYYTSPDFGVTWDLEHLYRTPLIASQACFNVEVDPRDPNTFYIAWEYNNINPFGRHQWPRTRWAVAKSTDGGTTWEFVGTVDENNHVSYTSSNMSMNVSKDYVLVNADALDDENGTNRWRGRVVIFPKDKAKTSKRFEQIHYQYETQMDSTLVIPKERLMQTLAIHPESGRVLLHGTRLEDAVSGEYLSKTVAERFLGQTVSVGSDAVIIIDGKEFVDISALAEAYGLTVAEDSGLLILSEIGDWSTRQKIALQSALGVF